MSISPTDLEDSAQRSHPAISDEMAYVLPMGIFLAFTWASGHWPGAYPWLYTIKAVLTAAALIVLRKHYTRIRWNFWWLGIVVGAVGIVQWVGMQGLLEKHFTLFQPSGESFKPFEAIHSPLLLYGFITVRVMSAVLVVPFMEELFWRDFLWRQILAPNDFKLARVGEWAPGPLLMVSCIFGVVHANWWLTAIIWAFMVGGMLVLTKSLGACILAHATSNLLLAIYVLKYHAWSLW